MKPRSDMDPYGFTEFLLESAEMGHAERCEHPSRPNVCEPQYSRP